MLFLLIPAQLGLFKKDSSLQNSPKEISNAISIVIPSNETCQYKELVESGRFVEDILPLSSVSYKPNCTYSETGELVTVLYDEENNKYTTPLDVTTQSGASILDWCNTFLYIKNNIDKKVSINLQYRAVSSQGGLRDKEISVDIPPFKTETITESFQEIKQSCDIPRDSIRYNFVSNEETSSKSEKVIEESCKIMVEVCKKCNGFNCLNDGDTCLQDYQCGSGICNIANLCGKEKIVPCPEGKTNKNDTCVETLFNKFKRNYFNISSVLFLITIISSLFSIALLRIKRKEAISLE